MNIGWLYNKSLYKSIGGTERTTVLAIDMLKKLGHRSYAFIIVNENDNTFSFEDEPINNIDEFKQCSQAIIVNRYDSCFDDANAKIYARGIFLRD